MAAPVRPLGDALRRVVAPTDADNASRFGQRYDWRNDNVHIQLTPCRTPTPGNWMHAIVDDKTLCIRVQPDQRHRIGERSWTDYDDDARLMAWTLVYDELVNTMAELLPGPFTPINIVSSPDIAIPELSANLLEFTIPGNDERAGWSGQISLDRKTCDAILEQATASPQQKTQGQWPALPLPIALRCDGPLIDATQLQSCARGDLIVLADRSRLIERMAAYGSDGRRLPVVCRTDADGVRITLDKQAARTNKTPNQETLTMSQTPPSPDDDTSLASQIPVRLAVQTATVDISLAELEKMESGMIVPLEAPVAGTNVTILANGAPVGDGELVAAGEKLAVCIRRWRPDGF